MGVRGFFRNRMAAFPKAFTRARSFVYRNHCGRYFILLLHRCTALQGSWRFAQDNRMLLSSGLGAAPLSSRILPHILLSRTGHHLQRGYTQRIPLICKIKMASLHQQKCGEVILYSGSFTTGCAQDRPTNPTRAVCRGGRARCPLRAG